MHQNLRTHFFESVFSLYVFCLYLFVLYLSLSMLFLDTCQIHQSYYVHVCACIVCMCMYLSVCISSRLPVTFSWWKTCLRYCPPQVITNHFLQVGQCMYVSVLRVCVCIVCMCLYGMNEGCISFYCSGGHKNHRRVPK